MGGLTYLGRFDWMNALDPPRGAFQFGFRFLPFTDADENGSCPYPEAHSTPGGGSGAK